MSWEPGAVAAPLYFAQQTEIPHFLFTWRMRDESWVRLFKMSVWLFSINRLIYNLELRLKSTIHIDQSYNKWTLLMMAGLQVRVSSLNVLDSLFVNFRHIKCASAHPWSVSQKTLAVFSPINMTTEDDHQSAETQANIRWKQDVRASQAKANQQGQPK